MKQSNENGIERINMKEDAWCFNRPAARVAGGQSEGVKGRLP